ncbi:MAG: CBS domain-containing protein, partial [Slackia sp.]|nr:CBS domain-containing protein [Slackia sp.]
AAALALVSAIGATAFCRAALKRSNAASKHAQAQQPTEIALLMEKTPFVVKGTMPVGEVMHELVNRKVSGMPVVDGSGVPIGFISDGDIMRYLSECHPAITSSYSLMEVANSQTFDEKLKELVALPVSHIATERVVSIPQDATLQEACTLLAQHKLKKVPVVQNGTIVGMLSRSDVIRYAMNNALAGIGE